MKTEDETQCIECVRLRGLLIELREALQDMLDGHHGLVFHERCRAAIDHAKDIQA